MVVSTASDNIVVPQATKVAVVQHNAGTDVDQNLSTLETLSKQAASEGAGLIAWAEAFAYLGRHDGKKEILEQLPEGGPILRRCQQLARTLGCDLLLGGFHEAMPDDSDRCYNTSVYLTSTGDIAAMYRKIHLFDVSIPDGPQLMESCHRAPFVETPSIGGRQGYSHRICESCGTWLQCRLCCSDTRWCCNSGPSHLAWLHESLLVAGRTRSYEPVADSASK